MYNLDGGIRKGRNPFCDAIINKQVKFSGGTCYECESENMYAVLEDVHVIFDNDLNVNTPPPKKKNMYKILETATKKLHSFYYGREPLLNLTRKNTIMSIGQLHSALNKLSKYTLTLYDLK